MLRRLLAFLVFGMSVGSLTAAAVAQEEETDTSPSGQTTSDASEQAKEGVPPPALSPRPEKVEAAPAPSTKGEAKPEASADGWRTEFHGYFRAPLAMGISSRKNPGDLDKPDASKHLQIAESRFRTMDWSYYSFAYTRLQEQDWAEITFHAKRKHVDAAVGFMGYWLAAAGFRNPDAAQAPGIAYLTLDSDFDFLGITPNAALKMGAFWPGYGYFEKYDTFTLGRFRHTGEQLKLTVPVTPEITVTLEQGFGAGRDGSFDYNTAQQVVLYAYKIGLNLVAYGNLRVDYLKYASVALHYNYEWTRDPELTAEMGENSGKSFADARKAYMSVVGGEANVQLPYFGRLWFSPSLINVRNGYLLGGQGGTEVMHAQGGMGIATNYLGWTNSPPDSTGTGSVLSIGGTYENSLSNVLPDSKLPEVKVSVFGLMARSKLDLPDKSDKSGPYPAPKNINQFKWGVDATVLPVEWFGVTLRYDEVNLLSKATGYNTNGYVFSAITARLALFSHYLSSECIFLQFSRYKYGDNMKLAALYPWGAYPVVAGAERLQNQGYGGEKPDENVLKLQAQITF